MEPNRIRKFEVQKSRYLDGLIRQLEREEKTINLKTAQQNFSTLTQERKQYMKPVNKD